MESGTFPGDKSKMLKNMKMSKSVLSDEIKFVEKTLQNYYTQNPEQAVLCHNDLHEGNIMITEPTNETEPIDLDTLIMVDYDQAAYGFRIWDILYSMSKWGFEPSDAHVDQFIQGTVY